MTHLHTYRYRSKFHQWKKRGSKVYKGHNSVTYLAEWIVILAEEWEGEVMIDKDHQHGRQKGGRTHGEEGKAGQQGEVRHLH